MENFSRMEEALREVETPIKSTRSCVVPKHQPVKKPLAAKEKEVKDGASNEEKGGASNSLSKEGAEQKDSPYEILCTIVQSLGHIFLCIF